MITNHNYNQFLYILMGETDINVSDRDLKRNVNAERVRKVRVNSDASPQRQNITANS